MINRAIFLTNDEYMGGPSKVCGRLFDALEQECEAHLIIHGKNVADASERHNVHKVFGLLQLVKLLIKFSMPDRARKTTFFAFGTKQSLYLIAFRLVTFDRKNRYVVRTGLNPFGSKVKKKSFFKNYLQQDLCNFAYRYFDVIITETNRVRDYWHQRYHGKNEVVFIPNPVRNFNTSKKYETLAAEASATTVFLAVGRLSFQKNFSFLIRCFSMIDIELRQNCRLMILGEGPERIALEEEIDKLGLSNNVSLHGFVENVDDYLQLCDVFCMTSRWEGGANALIEAVCSSKRIVAVDCPVGPSEILSGYGYGTLIEAGDEDAFTQAMIDCCTLSSPIPDQKHSNQYSMPSVKKSYLKLLVG